MGDQLLRIAAMMRETLPEYTQREPNWRTGRYVAGVLQPDPSDGLDAGYIWVHREDTRAEDRALIGAQLFGWDRQAGQSVEVGLNERGERVAIKVLEASRTAAANAAARKPAAQGTPYPHHLITGGRVILTSGLTVFIEDLTYPGGVWQASYTTLVPTATSAAMSWLLVGIDQITGLATQALGGDHALAEILSPGEVTAIRAVSPNVLWLWAFVVANGATSLDYNSSIDLRYPAIEALKHAYAASSAPSVDDDVTLGYSVGSTWYDGADIYDCTDASTGAAVWTLRGGGGGAGGGMHVVGTVLHDETLGSTGSFDVTALDQTYDWLELRLHLRGSVSAADDSARIFFNNDATLANYRHQSFYGNNGSTGVGAADITDCAYIPAASEASGNFSDIVITIDHYAGSDPKNARSVFYTRRGATDTLIGSIGINWENTAAITRIQIQTDNDPTDQFVTGSRLQIIGWKEEGVGGAAVTSDDNVSNPPTDAELTSAFGSVGDGFFGLVDDNGAGTTVWGVLRKNGAWWTWATALAV